MERPKVAEGVRGGPAAAATYNGRYPTVSFTPRARKTSREAREGRLHHPRVVLRGRVGRVAGDAGAATAVSFFFVRRADATVSRAREGTHLRTLRVTTRPQARGMPRYMTSHCWTLQVLIEANDAGLFTDAAFASLSGAFYTKVFLPSTARFQHLIAPPFN